MKPCYTTKIVEMAKEVVNTIEAQNEGEYLKIRSIKFEVPKYRAYELNELSKFLKQYYPHYKIHHEKNKTIISVER